jgi:GNAT superfamily N-acetyltransferase
MPAAPSDAPLTIRMAEPADSAILIEFNRRMAREVEGLELDPADAAGGVEAVFADSRKGLYWIAERGGRVVGHLLTSFEWSPWHNGRLCWLLSLYIVPEARGRWVYQKLLEHVRRAAASWTDVLWIRLYIDRRNFAAHRLARSLGMIGDRYARYEWMK